jgi:hypothetical protein
VSKAALIRRYVGERLRPLPPLEEDRLWDIVGMVRGGPNDSLRVNEVVLMRRLAVREALAFDGDFAAAGFVELRA